MEDHILSICEGVSRLGLKSKPDTFIVSEAEARPKRKIKFTNLVSMRPVTPWQAAKLKRTISQLAIVRPQHRSNRSGSYQNMGAKVKVAETATTGPVFKLSKQCEDDTEAWLNEYVVKDCRNIQGYVKTNQGHKGARTYGTFNPKTKMEGYNKKHPRQKQKGSKTSVKRELGFNTEC